MAPVTASMRRTPAATPPSLTILNRPMSPVRCTCVPPHSSRLVPMSSTRTVSPYFSPNSIMAPVVLADSMSITRACVGWLARISALTRASRSRGSARRSPAWLCVKSKRVLSASTSEPFCCTCSPSTSRSALCIRWVTLWLRMVAWRARDVDLGRDRVADLQRALRLRAVVAEHVGLDLLRVVDAELHAFGRRARPGRRPGRRSRHRTAWCRAPRCPAGLRPAAAPACRRSTARRPWPALPAARSR